MINIIIDENALKSAAVLFADTPKEVQKAASAAVNRTITRLRKESSVTIRKEYIVKAATIKKAFNLKKANSNRTTGMLMAKGSPLRLSDFKLARPKHSAIKVQVRKDGGLKPIKGLFINLHKGLLQRTTRTAYPLRVPYGPSVPQMFGNEKTLEALAPLAEKILNERFLHEVQYRYEKIYGGTL